jgi:hypothetical protein
MLLNLQGQNDKADDQLESNFVDGREYGLRTGRLAACFRFDRLSLKPRWTPSASAGKEVLKPLEQGVIRSLCVLVMKQRSSTKNRISGNRSNPGPPAKILLSVVWLAPRFMIFQAHYVDFVCHDIRSPFDRGPALLPTTTPEPKTQVE